MRRNTRVFGGILDVIPVNVDPDLEGKSSSDVGLHDLSVCNRCSDTIFSPVTWAHLRGDTLKHPIPEVDGDKSDYHILTDPLTVVKRFTGEKNLPKRGPAVHFEIPAKDILESGGQSCGFCKLLIRLDPNGRILAEPDKKRVLRLQVFWPEKVSGCVYPMVLEISLHADYHGGGQAWRMAFFKEPDDEALLHSSKKAAPWTSDETCNRLLYQAAEWLRNCESTHDRCSLMDNQRLPTRILDLAQRPGQTASIRLVESADVVNEKYAMLSYVWGTSPNNTLCLDQTTHSTFRIGISFGDLPRTIQEAVSVASALRLRYLWVDALCILQDSDIDKSREIPHMSEYYKNAHVVISASGGKDVRSGFIPPQDSWDSLYDGIQNEDDVRQRFVGSGPLKIPGHFANHSRSLLVNVIPRMYRYNAEAINNRGWTLQESVLPRRLLTFPGSGGLLMRCLEGESLAGEVISDPFHETPSSNSLGVVSSDGRSEMEILDLWMRMVEDYTQRSRSQWTDALIAIGALAREFHAAHGPLLGRFLGGLWENHVRSGLLWRNMEQVSAAKSEKSSQYVAPSWSWASCPSRIVACDKIEMDLRVGFNTTREETWYITRWYCKILGFDITLQSESDPFGALRAGFLTIQGPLRALQRQTDKSDDSAETKFKSAGCPDLYLKEATRTEALILDRPLVIPDHTGSEEPQYYWLAIWYAGRSRARGLILHQINETSFKRLGYAEFMVDEAVFTESELHREPVIQLV